MSEHKWEFGDWAETPSGETRLRVIHVDSRHIRCIDARGLTYLESLPTNLTRLPDCDSFDWQPPQPPLQLREGAWYERRDGEIVGPCHSRGDETRTFPWSAGAQVYTDSGNYWSSGDEHDYDLIREVPAPAPTYRPFANGEEYKPHRDRWVRSKATGETWRVCAYSDDWIQFADTGVPIYSAALVCFVFDDDGSPFGVQQ